MDSNISSVLKNHQYVGDTINKLQIPLDRREESQKVWNHRIHETMTFDDWLAPGGEW